MTFVHSFFSSVDAALDRGVHDAGLGALLAILVAVCPKGADAADVACAGQPSLTSAQQSGLMMASDRFRVVYIDRQGQAQSLELLIETPGAFQGDEFPPDVCFAQATLTGQARLQVGRVSYTAPDTAVEHQGWSYEVTFGPQSAVARMLFSMPNGLHQYGMMADADGALHPLAGWSFARER